MEKEKENQNMSKEDLEKTINDTVLTAVAGALEKVKEDAETEKKEEIEKEIEEKKPSTKVATVEEDQRDTAEKEASQKDWPNFGEFLKKVWLYRGGYNRFPDNRLIYVNEKGIISNPTEPKKVDNEEALLKTMTEGTDSAGGYGIICSP